MEYTVPFIQHKDKFPVILGKNIIKYIAKSILFFSALTKLTPKTIHSFPHAAMLVFQTAAELILIIITLYLPLDNSLYYVL